MGVAIIILYYSRILTIWNKKFVLIFFSFLIFIHFLFFLLWVRGAIPPALSPWNRQWAYILVQILRNDLTFFFLGPLQAVTVCSLDLLTWCMAAEWSYSGVNNINKFKTWNKIETSQVSWSDIIVIIVGDVSAADFHHFVLLRRALKRYFTLLNTEVHHP